MFADLWIKLKLIIAFSARLLKRIIAMTFTISIILHIVLLNI